MSATVPDQTLLVSLDGPIATITLNRPEKLNALTLPMLAALEETLLAIDADPEIRALARRPSQPAPTWWPGPASHRSTCGEPGRARATG